MADSMDDNGKNLSGVDKNGEVSQTEPTEKGDDVTLECFVTQEYEKQKADGRMNDTDNIDADRTANFFTRALGESQRMSKEVDKSHQKLAGLHAELGAENISQWQAEHASEELTKQEISTMNHTTKHLS